MAVAKSELQIPSFAPGFSVGEAHEMMCSWGNRRRLSLSFVSGDLRWMKLGIVNLVNSHYRTARAGKGKHTMATLTSHHSQRLMFSSSVYYATLSTPNN